MARRLVAFDVDSTLLSVESLDIAVERALRLVPDGPERSRALSQLTDQGMAGHIDFRTSLERRIAIAGLTRDSVADASEALRSCITPGMGELLADLRQRGDVVQAVSGGFVDLVGPALGDLGFTAEDIHANRFVFDASGAVVDFDRDRPTSRSHGKAEAIHGLKADFNIFEAVMVGDGMTDFEAYDRGGADHFIGFGGIVSRAAVKAKAKVWADNVGQLKALLT